MLSLWINYIIASVSLFIALMSWFRVRPTDVAKAIQRKVPQISEPLGMVAMAMGSVVVGIRAIQELMRGDVPWGRLVSLGIIIYCFFWTLTIILSRQKNKT